MINTLPLVETVARLEKRLALVDSNTLEQIRQKASKLKEELERVVRTRQGMQLDSAMFNAIEKVDVLSMSLSKVEPIAEELPTVILRLKTLEKVHQQRFAKNKYLLTYL